MRAVVTGANRGIGLELVRQLVRRGDSVLAAVREPARATELCSLAGATGERLRVLVLDIDRAAAISSFAAELGDTTAVDLLINNAGVYGGPRQTLRDFDFEGAMQVF